MIFEQRQTNTLQRTDYSNYFHKIVILHATVPVSLIHNTQLIDTEEIKTFQLLGCRSARTCQ